MWGGAVVVTFICAIIGYICKNKGPEMLNHIANYGLGNHQNSLIILVYSVVVFCLFLCFNDEFNMCEEVTRKVIIMVSSVSFEIYLTGDISLHLLYPVLGSNIYYCQKNGDISVDLQILIYAFGAWTSSFVISVLIKYVKGLVCKCGLQFGNRVFK